jgi:hypothetical protein
MYYMLFWAQWFGKSVNKYELKLNVTSVFDNVYSLVKNKHFLGKKHKYYKDLLLTRSVYN